MIACVDVDYRADEAVAACIVFDDWRAAQGVGEVVERVSPVAPYEPGKFYRRELPCLLAVLSKVGQPLETIVVDSYVWLHDEQSPGLGGHLFEALQQRVPIIGVAKTQFLSAGAAQPVLRGNSKRPLFVTAAGVDLPTACRHIQRMHGNFRIPTLLKRVDQLCRGPYTLSV
jgi:deoxyribonuclease V